MSVSIRKGLWVALHIGLLEGYLQVLMLLYFRHLPSHAPSYHSDDQATSVSTKFLQLNLTNKICSFPTIPKVSLQ